MKIVVLDGYSLNPGDLDWDILNEFGEVKVYDRTTAEDVIERSKDADIILTNKVEIDYTTIQELPKLKMIAVLATGYNIIDCKAAREAGVTVTNIPAYSTDSVAQMVFAHLLNIINRVQYYTDENRNLRWSNNPDFCYWDNTFHELAGKKIGIIGLGHIGSRVAHIADAFGMQVIAMTSKHQEELPLYINKVEKDELLRTADV
ncbi:MAG: NAD(P)-dependent oxidoreductase, partial [Prevotella sp.]|nr:NAD(P)-dependent oxidoreductase [Prevotella sp.]